MIAADGHRASNLYASHGGIALCHAACAYAWTRVAAATTVRAEPLKPKPAWRGLAGQPRRWTIERIFV